MKCLHYLCALTACIGAAQAQKPAGIPGIMAEDAKVERVATGFKFTEGPVWDGSSVLFTDIPADTIFRWTPNVAGASEGKISAFRNPSGQANGLTLDAKKNLIACEHKTRRVSRTVNGQAQTIAERFEGKRFNSPNDACFAADGALYFTDPIYGLPDSKLRELDYEGVFRLAPDGKITLLARDFVHPNGIALSPDGKRLYVADSDPNLSHIRVFDVLADGTLANGKVFAVCKTEGLKNPPDGLKVDKAGNVYTSAPGGVWVLAPSGTLLGLIPVPENTTNVAWGDADGKTLFITAQKSLYRVRLLAEGLMP